MAFHIYYRISGFIQDVKCHEQERNDIVSFKGSQVQVQQSLAQFYVHKSLTLDIRYHTERQKDARIRQTGKNNPSVKCFYQQLHSSSPFLFSSASCAVISTYLSAYNHDFGCFKEAQITNKLMR